MQELQATNPELSEEDIAKLAAAKVTEQQPHDRLWYRINATRFFGGNPKLMPSLKPKLQQVEFTLLGVWN